jgi:Protein of unknown function (DUF 659)
LTLPTLTAQAEHAADVLAALAVYECNIPFTIFEKPAMLKLHYHLNPAYRPPTARQLASTLLNEAYDTVKKEVDAVIDENSALGITFDETSNVNSDRILNITISTRRGIFYYLNVVLPTETASSQLITEIVYKALISVSRNRIDRINAVSTDTCKTIRSIWRILQRQPGLEYCFMIPCDSHGLQLLIMDILKSSPFAILTENANQLVGHLKHSSKRLTILRDLQQKEYSKPRALKMANSTRWGTHFKEFESIIENKQALRRWAIDQRVDFTTSDTSRAISKNILDPLFFVSLEELKSIIEPIHNALIESEGENAHLSLVRGRWAKLYLHFKKAAALLTVNFKPILDKYDIRYKRQVVDLHHLAYWLYPANVVAHRFESNEMQRMLKTLKKLIPSYLWPTVEILFFYYYNKQGAFDETNEFWR